MASLADASLTAEERRVVERLVELLREEFGPDLHAVWLYGSRARGEPPYVFDPEWVTARRAIDSFFMREVDRDKVVLFPAS